MQLIVGLGNPGKDYQNTRHNIGQMAIRALADKLNLTFNHNSKLEADLLEIGQGSGKTIFALPNTYMNLSGRSVQKILNFYKIEPHNLFVVHDDLDLGVGEWKVQFDRGSAGHNGIKSIVENLNTQAFNRIRIGIGHPRQTNPNLPVEDYVLLPFTVDEKVIIKETVDKIVADFDNWARS